MSIQLTPGLHRRTGHWGVCVGFWKPVVMIDPLAEVKHGANALVVHEATHMHKRHALWATVILVLTLGTLYPWYRKRCETQADALALATLGLSELKGMVCMTSHPTSRWGMYLYGSSTEERILRAAAFLGRKKK